MHANFKNKVAIAAGWSAVQSWAIKFAGILVFFVLARYLSPAELGLAQTIALVLAFVAVVSEQGFHRALVQRPQLRAADVNLPFFLSVAVAVAASIIMLLMADQVAALLGEPKSAELLRYAAVIPPLTAATGILVAMFRRDMDFRTIAQASLVASLVSCVIAILMAVNGFGALSLVAQAVASGVVTTLMMWRRPIWTPTLHIDTQQFRGILSYSTLAFASQLIDFFSRRLIDFIILSRYGFSALGVYTVGAKLYITVLELLSVTLTEVMLSAMSRLTADIERFRPAYLRLLFIASCTSLPLFFLLAATSPELCRMLFGGHWDYAAQVAQLLCILGGFETVQLFNINALGAAGKARAVLLINSARLALGALALLVFHADSVVQLTAVFVISQLLVFPFSFIGALRVTHTRLRDVIPQIMPGFFAAVLALASVYLLRAAVESAYAHVFVRALLLGAVFAGVYIAALFLVSKNRVLQEIGYIVGSYRR